ncbi:MAG: hypothetical protein WC717_00735 [Candidatus Micrarchaeia archaeon]|jgi:hypothetical protein
MKLMNGMGNDLRNRVLAVDPPKGMMPKARVFEMLLELSPSNQTSCRLIAPEERQRGLYGISKSGIIYPLEGKNAKCVKNEMVLSADGWIERENWPKLLMDCRTILPYCVFYERIPTEHKPVHFGIPFQWKATLPFDRLCDGLDAMGAKDGEGYLLMYEQGKPWIAAKGEATFEGGSIMREAPISMFRKSITVAMDCQVVMKREKIADVFIVAHNPEWEIRLAQPSGEGEAMEKVLEGLNGIFARVRKEIAHLLPNPRMFNVLEIGMRKD